MPDAASARQVTWVFDLQDRISKKIMSVRDSMEQVYKQTAKLNNIKISAPDIMKSAPNMVKYENDIQKMAKDYEDYQKERVKAVKKIIDWTEKETDAQREGRFDDAKHAGAKKKFWMKMESIPRNYMSLIKEDTNKLRKYDKDIIKSSIEQVTEMQKISAEKIISGRLSIAKPKDMVSAQKMLTKYTGVREKLTRKITSLSEKENAASKAGLSVTKKTIGENISNLTKQRSALGQRISLLKGDIKTMKSGTDAITLQKTAMSGFWKVIGMSREQWTGFNKAGNTFNTAGGKLANKIRMMTHGLRGFRMEMLSVMFFGMNLAKQWGGFSKSARDMLGITDYLTTTLQMMTVDALLPQIDIIYELIDGLNELPDTAKAVIGWSSILADAFGNVLFFFGSFMLGIGGLIQAFGGAPAFLESGIGKLFGFIFDKIGVTADAFSKLITGLGQTGAMGNMSGLFTMGVGWAENAWETLGTKTFTLFGETFTAKDAIKKTLGAALAINATLDIINMVVNKKFDITKFGLDTFQYALAAKLWGIEQVAGIPVNLLVAITLVISLLPIAYDFGVEIGKLIPPSITKDISVFLNVTPIPTGIAWIDNLLHPENTEKNEQTIKENQEAMAEASPFAVITNTLGAFAGLAALTYGIYKGGRFLMKALPSIGKFGGAVGAKELAATGTGVAKMADVWGEGAIWSEIAGATGVTGAKTGIAGGIPKILKGGLAAAFLSTIVSGIAGAIGNVASNSEVVGSATSTGGDIGGLLAIALGAGLTDVLAATGVGAIIGFGTTAYAKYFTDTQDAIEKGKNKLDKQWAEGELNIGYAELMPNVSETRSIGAKTIDLFENMGSNLVRVISDPMRAIKTLFDGFKSGESFENIWMDEDAFARLGRKSDEVVDTTKKMITDTNNVISNSNIKESMDVGMVNPMSDASKIVSLVLPSYISSGVNSALNILNAASAGTKTAIDAGVKNPIYDSSNLAANNLIANIKNAISGTQNSLTTSASGTKTAVQTGIKNPTDEVMNALKISTTSISKSTSKEIADSITNGKPYLQSSLQIGLVNPYIAAVDNILNTLSRIPSISSVNKTATTSLNTKTINSILDMFNIFGFKFPHFARGGIVSAPTLAMVGEAGPEIIAPVNSLGNGENNSITYINIPIDKISSDIDIAELAYKVNQELQWNYRRSTMR